MKKIGALTFFLISLYLLASTMSCSIDAFNGKVDANLSGTVDGNLNANFDTNADIDADIDSEATIDAAVSADVDSELDITSKINAEVENHSNIDTNINSEVITDSININPTLDYVVENNVNLDFETNVITDVENSVDASDENNEESESNDGDGSDVDSDGIADSIDNCPEVSNSNQLDTDADEIGDLCDSNNVDFNDDDNEASPVIIDICKSNQDSINYSPNFPASRLTIQRLGYDYYEIEIKDGNDHYTYYRMSKNRPHWTHHDSFSSVEESRNSMNWNRSSKWYKASVVGGKIHMFIDTTLFDTKNDGSVDNDLMISIRGRYNYVESSAWSEQYGPVTPEIIRQCPGEEIIKINNKEESNGKKNKE